MVNVQPFLLTICLVLQLQNILYSWDGTLKVADFGLARCSAPGQRLRGYVGTLSFMAPEILRGRGDSGPPIDVWASGIILHSLFTKRYPFRKRKLRKIMSPFDGLPQYHPPAWLSKPCTSLLSSMVCEDAMKRISLQEIMNHTWFEHFPGTPWRNRSQCEHIDGCC
uniref:uncharacterized protein n=1 Tax=Myxine glutinosa TaxID=7769 RepID=UPI00358ED4D4